MMKIAQAWYDDPDGTYTKTIEGLESAFKSGVISGYECGQARGVADRCRDQAKAENAKREDGVQDR
jgi:hypothetical protein